MRVVADHDLARPHEAVVGHHLVRDAGFGIVKAADAETFDFAPDQRIFVGLLLRQRRLVMVEQHEDAVAVPHPRQSVLETGLRRQIDQRLVGVVMHHCAVDARFEEVAALHRLAGEVVAREQFFGNGLSHGVPVVLCQPRWPGNSCFRRSCWAERT